MNGSTYFYDLDVSFTPTGAPTGAAAQTQSFRAPQAVFDGHDTGGPVQITYVRSHPTWFYVTGAEPDPANLEIIAKLQLSGAIAAAFLALPFFASLWLARNVGKPAPGVGASSAPIRPVAGRAQGGFGVRNL
jgi:hypothetical protein